jgi:hypothetical protein
MADELEVTIKVPVDEDWVDVLTNYNDIFLTSYCGYWLYGVSYEKGRGWLAYEMEDERRPGEKKCQRATEAWKAGLELPKGFFRIDRDLAIKVQKIVTEKYGKDAWDNAPDASMQDVGMQLALLGEVRYG